MGLCNSSAHAAASDPWGKDAISDTALAQLIERISQTNMSKKDQRDFLNDRYDLEIDNSSELIEFYKYRDVDPKKEEIHRCIELKHIDLGVKSEEKSSESNERTSNSTEIIDNSDCCSNEDAEVTQPDPKLRLVAASCKKRMERNVPAKQVPLSEMTPEQQEALRKKYMSIFQRNVDRKVNDPDNQMCGIHVVRNLIKNLKPNYLEEVGQLPATNADFLKYVDENALREAIMTTTDFVLHPDIVAEKIEAATRNTAELIALREERRGQDYSMLYCTLKRFGIYMDMDYTKNWFDEFQADPNGEKYQAWVFNSGHWSCIVRVGDKWKYFDNADIFEKNGRRYRDEAAVNGSVLVNSVEWFKRTCRYRETYPISLTEPVQIIEQIDCEDESESEQEPSPEKSQDQELKEGSAPSKATINSTKINDGDALNLHANISDVSSEPEKGHALTA